MRTVPRIAVAMLSLFLTGVAIVGAAAPASATDYYRYWSYFNVDSGSYLASEQGVGATVPKDGTVDAYRYAAPDPKQPSLPRLDLSTITFDAVCSDTAEAAGSKRVAVLVDYGVDADAEGQAVPEPTVACASVPTKATGMQVLQSVAEVRTKTSSFGPLLCGIDGFPAKGCADEVTKQATPADDGFLDVTVATAGDTGTTTDTSGDTSSESDSGSSTGLYAGLGVLVVVLLGGGVVLARRNRSA